MIRVIFIGKSCHFSSHSVGLQNTALLLSVFGRAAENRRTCAGGTEPAVREGQSWWFKRVPSPASCLPAQAQAAGFTHSAMPTSTCQGMDGTRGTWLEKHMPKRFWTPLPRVCPLSWEGAGKRGHSHLACGRGLQGQSTAQGLGRHPHSHLKGPE